METSYNNWMNSNRMPANKGRGRISLIYGSCPSSFLKCGSKDLSHWPPLEYTIGRII